MRAWVLHEFGGEPRLETLPDPEPGPGEALVEVAACGVGLTTRNCIRGDLGEDAGLLPVVPGHEIVGTVRSVGAGVREQLVGDLVTTHFYLFCGCCRRCLSGEEPLCQNLAGVIGVQRGGGLAELVALPARNLLPLPPGLEPEDATVIPDAVATPVHVAKRAGITTGATVAVVGAGGGVGAHMVQVAQAAGAAVVGLDIDPAKLEMLAGDLGVDVIDSSDLGRTELPARWGGEAEVVVDFVGSPATIAWALARLAPGGRLVLLTTFRDVVAAISPRDLVLGQHAILGSRYASRAEVLAAAELLRSGAVRPVIGRRTTLEGAGDLLAAIDRNEVVGRGVVAVGPRVAAQGAEAQRG